MLAPCSWFLDLARRVKNGDRIARPEQAASDTHGHYHHGGKADSYFSCRCAVTWTKGVLSVVVTKVLLQSKCATVDVSKLRTPRRRHVPRLQFETGGISDAYQTLLVGHLMLPCLVTVILWTTLALLVTVILWTTLALLVLCDVDYYKVLGVGTARKIREKGKKLAVS